MVDSGLMDKTAVVMPTETGARESAVLPIPPPFWMAKLFLTRFGAKLANQDDHRKNRKTASMCEYL